MMKSCIPLAAVMLAVSGCVPTPEPECYERPISKDGPWILTDHYHARKQNNEDYVLNRDAYGYQGVFGFRRVFDHLERGGYNWGSIRTMELSPERLEGYDTLFINLVSSDRPDFTDAEVDAIIDFVDNGGGLFVIADHTNVYRHAERVNRFLIPMGIEVLYHIAVDFPPEHSVAGLGWILVDDFTDHPVAEGLDMISLQTGGPMKTENAEGAVAFSSEDSFADFWDPEDDGGYYGNWTFDGDEEVEPKGPLEVHAAVEFGEGRVVVAGDQNMFGDAWTHYVDNFQVFMNSMEWATQQEGLGDQPLRELDPVGTLVGMNQPKIDFRGGKPGGDGLFAFYVNLNRDAEISGRGSIRLDNEEDVLMFINPQEDFTEAELDAVREYLRAGKKVVVTFEPDSATSSTVGLLTEFAPDFALTSGDTSASLDELTEFSPSRLEGDHLPLVSEKMDVEGIELASYDGDPTGDEVEPGAIPPYLYDVTSDWGDPLVQADAGGGKLIDIARSATVEDGELIIFVQDGFFKNRTLGPYLRAPKDYNRPAHLLQFSLLDYVKVEDAPEPPGGFDDDNPPARVCE